MLASGRWDPRTWEGVELDGVVNGSGRQRASGARRDCESSDAVLVEPYRGQRRQTRDTAAGEQRGGVVDQDGGVGGGRGDDMLPAGAPRGGAESRRGGEPDLCASRSFTARPFMAVLRLGGFLGRVGENGNGFARLGKRKCSRHWKRMAVDCAGKVVSAGRGRHTAYVSGWGILGVIGLSPCLEKIGIQQQTGHPTR